MEEKIILMAFFLLRVTKFFRIEPLIEKLSILMDTFPEYKPALLLSRGWWTILKLDL